VDPTIRNKTITRLKEEIPELSPRLQVAAKYIVDHPADFGLDSIRDTARKADVSTYTLVRISERLGFDSYEDMRDPFRVALVAPTQFIDAPEWINRWRESGEIGQKQAEAALNSMAIVQRSLEGQNLKQLQRVAEMLLGAKNVYLTAVRASYSIAYYFHYVGRMALPSLQLIPRHINSAIDELNYADEGDVMIAITLTPYSRETIEACEFARKKGVKLVMISDSEVISSNFTPEETLVASTLSTHHFGCYTGVMAVAENLVSLLVALGGQDVKDRITSYETLRKDNNAYWVAKKKH
jgi:DNA-binding MurR/RpiR family transcriptional regulator